ncbi:MAG: Crp/Fnr family transcriptional regulator [Proteobacteria bacterium]|nr:Crp/Fnr family transcriptional regulator [Pseudomonadota bacterium]MBU1708531.1 Crp/Fnr family transcriptional regulator [Pseudomonadota bacterium]
MEITRLIASTPLFEGLSQDQCDELAMIVTDQEFKKGQTIFSEGDDGVGFYVVVSGMVKIYKLSYEGKEQILHIFGEGEPFAEVAVFTGTPYPAHALALEKSRIFFFPRNAFVGLIMKNPSLAMNMLASLSLRLKRFAHLIEDLSLKEVPGRLATHLLLLSRQQQGSEDLQLQIPKSQLASLLGTIPETLSRILTKMSKQGLIEINGANIRIQARDELEELAEGGRRL